MAFKDVFQFVCERRVFARLFEAKFSEGHQPEVLVDLLGEHKKLSTTEYYFRGTSKSVYICGQCYNER